MGFLGSADFGREVSNLGEQFLSSQDERVECEGELTFGISYTDFV